MGTNDWNGSLTADKNGVEISIKSDWTTLGALVRALIATGAALGVAQEVVEMAHRLLSHLGG